MPFLRVIRDRRGYETTYLMHWFQEGARRRSRVLYVFRSPAGVRIGRGALDPDTLDEIERQFPDVSFPWHEVRAGQQVVDVGPEPRRRRPKSVESEEVSATPDVPELGSPGEPVPSALVGATSDEQVAFLTLWYPRVIERVTRTIVDPERRDAFLVLAEQLNPAGWTDADALAEGLSGAADALERLAHVLGRRRRRQRRRSGPGPSGGPVPTSP